MSSSSRSRKARIRASIAGGCAQGVPSSDSSGAAVVSDPRRIGPRPEIALAEGGHGFSALEERGGRDAREDALGREHGRSAVPRGETGRRPLEIAAVVAPEQALVGVRLLREAASLDRREVARGFHGGRVALQVERERDRVRAVAAGEAALGNRRHERVEAPRGRRLHVLGGGEPRDLDPRLRDAGDPGLVEGAARRCVELVAARRRQREAREAAEQPVHVGVPEDGAAADEERRLEEAEAALDGRREVRERRLFTHGVRPPFRATSSTSPPIRGPRPSPRRSRRPRDSRLYRGRRGPSGSRR